MLSETHSTWSFCFKIFRSGFVYTACYIQRYNDIYNGDRINTAVMSPRAARLVLRRCVCVFFRPFSYASFRVWIILNLVVYSGESGIFTMQSYVFTSIFHHILRVMTF